MINYKMAIMGLIGLDVFYFRMIWSLKWWKFVWVMIFDITDTSKYHVYRIISWKTFWLWFDCGNQYLLVKDDVMVLNETFLFSQRWLRRVNKRILFSIFDTFILFSHQTRYCLMTRYINSISFYLEKWNTLSFLQSQ